MTTMGALTLFITLTLGSSGIVMNSQAGAVTLSTRLNLGANQTWTNNSANTLTISAVVANVGNTSPFTLTLSSIRGYQFRWGHSGWRRNQNHRNRGEQGLGGCDF